MARYRIASFNIKQFSDNSAFHTSGNESKKDLDVIGRIVRDNGIDIIAIQEIRGKIAFKELMSSIAYGYSKDITYSMLELPGTDGEKKLSSELMGADYLACVAGKWQGRWTHPNSKYGTAISEEGYAFIWNSEKFDLPQNERGRIQPVIKHKSEQYFVRPPFYGRFITKNIPVKFEIRLLNTHVLYTSKAELKKLKDSGIDVDMLGSNDPMERRTAEQEILAQGVSLSELEALKQFVSQNDIERRRSEVRNLITEVMAREEDDKGWGSYVFLIGDYNLNINSSGVNYKNRSATIEDTIVYARNKSNETKVYSICQRNLSTLKSPPADEEKSLEYDELIGENRYANNYDHVTYNSNMCESNGRGIYISDVTRIDVIERYGLSNREYFQRISDHFPIMFEIGFGED